MKFWTTLGFNRRTRNRYQNTNGHLPFDVGGTAEDGEEGVAKAYVLVDPEPQDFLALNNAAVYPYNDRVFVALPPVVADNGHVLSEREASSNHEYRPWFKEKKYEGCFLIRDGVQVSMCAGCDKILHRAAGACTVGSANCGQKFFRQLAIMNEPSGQYLPPANCCNREPFSTYTIHDLCTGTPVEEMMEGPKRDSRSVLRAILTKQISQLSCSVCMFGYQRTRYGRNRKAWACGAGRSCAKYCNGPFFSSDVPEPTVHQRVAVRQMGQAVTVAKYQEAAKKYKWPCPNWRTLPDIEVAYCNEGFIKSTKPPGPIPLSLIVLPSRNRRSEILTDFKDWAAVKASGLIQPVKAPTKPATTMERLLCWQLSKGMLHRGETRGWGYTSYLGSAVYHDHRDTAELHYNLATFGYTRKCDTVSDLFSFGHKHIGDVNRGSDIVAIMETRKLGSNVERDVMRKTLKVLSEAEKAGEPIPDITDTYQQLLFKHK